MGKEEEEPTFLELLKQFRDNSEEVRSKAVDNLLELSYPTWFNKFKEELLGFKVPKESHLAFDTILNLITFLEKDRVRIKLQESVIKELYTIAYAALLQYYADPEFKLKNKEKDEKFRRYFDSLLKSLFSEENPSQIKQSFNKKIQYLTKDDLNQILAPGRPKSEIIRSYFASMNNHDIQDRDDFEESTPTQTINRDPPDSPASMPRKIKSKKKEEEEEL